MTHENLTTKSQTYIDEGLSIFPCKLDKTPYYPIHISSLPGNHTNKICQTVRMQMPDLFPYIDKGCNIGIMCGQISGNLECIDVDSKYKVGFDAIILQDLNQLFPELLKKLRIQRTPSGGLHLIYRCTQLVAGNKKLAGRLKTEEELEKSPKGKTVNFLETRGEGGYFLGYPSAGYTMVNDLPIPILTPEERNTLLGLCSSYCELPKDNRPKYEGQRKEEGTYQTSPFDDFNYRCDPVQTLDQFGYKFINENNRFIQFTRPDKSSGVSVSFIKEHRLYYFFTSSTDFENEKGFSPCAIINKYLHNGNWKDTYQYLIQNGYGKLKPQVEQRIIKQASQGVAKLPPNLSFESHSAYNAIKTQLDTHCKYGVFWFETQREGIQIDRERLLTVSQELGFRYYQGDVVMVNGGVIYYQTERQVYDTLKKYIYSTDADELNDIYVAYSRFMEKHAKWITSRLEFLDETKIQKDTKTKSYKHYLNGTLKIDKDGSDFKEGYTDLRFETQIQKRNFDTETPIENGGKYHDFLNKAIGVTPYLMKYIGFLCHEYKDESINYLAILTETVPDPKQGGGSGKNVFCNLLKFSTTITSKPAEAVKYDASLLQTWNGQKVFVLSDAPKGFNFGFFKEYTSGEASIKKLYKDERNVAVEDMPKILVTTNFSIDISDGGLKRRVRMLEFTDFFTKAGGVDVHYNCMFPHGWSKEDWIGYDKFIALCIEQWLAANCKLEIVELSEGGWEKLFHQSYKSIAQFIEDNFPVWCEQQWITVSEFNEQLNRYYIEANINKVYHLSSQKVNSALAEYSSRHGYDFNPNASKTNFGKVKTFSKINLQV
jgi:hypothetical protein